MDTWTGIKQPVWVASGALLLLVVLLTSFILRLNDGMLVYTLDDPYIHLALAENILNGHYGVNESEVSAPSSSILWPFLLAPVSAFTWAPFVINLLAALGTVLVSVRLCMLSVTIRTRLERAWFVTPWSIGLVLMTNLVGLVFLGMEHSLQVFAVAVIAYGLVRELENRELTWWLIAAIIIAPLMRYENLAVSSAAVAYLILRARFWPALGAAVVAGGLMASFSLFLLNLGLEYLPTSILVKSSLADGSGLLGQVRQKIFASMIDPRGQRLVFGGLFLFGYVVAGRDSGRKRLALAALLGIGLHIVAGQYGWFNRYEIYIWLFLVLMITAVYGKAIRAGLETSRRAPFAAMIFLVAMTGYLGERYIRALPSVPMAANNIYQQHYQMHRFAVDFYQKPVAVNDLGYVAYKNDHYVLDLWGLSSLEALRLRKEEKYTEWMKTLTDEEQVGLAMIYRSWFRIIPEAWQKVGELRLGAPRVTPAASTVHFYATSAPAAREIGEILPGFIETLPEGVEFELAASPR